MLESKVYTFLHGLLESNRYTVLLLNKLRYRTARAAIYSNIYIFWTVLVGAPCSENKVRGTFLFFVLFCFFVF